MAAMEALFEFTLVDPNRNVFSMDLKLESSASPEWNDAFMMTKDNYTEMQEVWVGTPPPASNITGSNVADITAKIFFNQNVCERCRQKPSLNTNFMVDLLIFFSYPKCLVKSEWL